MRQSRFSLATANVLRAVGCDAGVIELWAEGRQTGFDVGATFAPRQLGEGPARGIFRRWAAADAGSCRGNGRHTCRKLFWGGSRGVGRDGATFVHKVKKPAPAVDTLRKVVAELKSKNDRSENSRFYRNEIAVMKTLREQ